MGSLPKVFIDSSVVLAAMRSDNAASPNLMLFKLGAMGYADLRISSGVLSECEGVLKRLDPGRTDENKTILANMLDRSGVGVAAHPSDSMVASCLTFTRYKPDAVILAAAVEVGCEVFVTYDRQHLLDNPEIGPPNARLVVVEVREALDWLQDRLLQNLRESREKKR